MKSGGQLRFGSDIIHYVDWALTRLSRHGGFKWFPKQQSDWRVRGDDWPETRYLKKAIRDDEKKHFSGEYQFGYAPQFFRPRHTTYNDYKWELKG